MLPWEATKRLLRLQGVAEELLNTARASGPEADEALGLQVNAVAEEVRSLLAEHDPALAEELQGRLAMASGPAVPVDVSAAVLVGWLRAGINAEALDERRAATAPPDVRRKQTIGFKIRSPITREQKLGPPS